MTTKDILKKLGGTKPMRKMKLDKEWKVIAIDIQKLAAKIKKLHGKKK